MAARDVQRGLFAAVALVAATALAYAGVVDNGFVVEFDDDLYVTRNPLVLHGLGLRALAGAFLPHEDNWIPLTWISHMLDVELFGLDAGRHHLVNVGLHAANAVLLLAALRALGAAFWESAFVAAVFALHPLRVESVAWIAERKDVLSGTFFMLALLAWSRYAQRPSAGRYAWVAAALALGLLAKPMLVTLPLVLLLLDFWPLRRWPETSARRLLLEKLPLLPLCLAAGLATLAAQRRGGALADLATLPFAARLANAALGTLAYVTHTLWPTGLAVVHPHPARVDPAGFGLADPRVLAAAALLAAATAGALWAARRRPWLCVGWLWFLGMLAPVSGIVQVGEQGWAERYAYLPTIGLAIAVAWSARELLAPRRHGPALLAALAGAALVGCLALTRAQVATWRDGVSLFQHALAHTRDNYVAHTYLGVALVARGEYDRARDHLDEALRIRPQHAPALVNLALLHLRRGEAAQALAWSERGLSASPGLAAAHNLRGLALSQLGRTAEAEASLERALALSPELADAWNNLGSVQLSQGRDAEALASFERALAADPALWEAQTNAGEALRRLGREQEARLALHRALRGNPGSEATAARLALLLATAASVEVRDGALALDLALALDRASGHADPFHRELVAAAHAELGDFEQAVRVQAEAVRLLPPGDAAAARRRLAAYRAGRPWREAPPGG